MTTTTPGWDGWLTPAEVRVRWPEADGIDEPILIDLVDAAREQCENYAPRLVAGQVFPGTWRVAHLMQTQALWRSMSAGPGDQFGGDGVAVTVFPMDWTVKNLLRPDRGIGFVV